MNYEGGHGQGFGPRMPTEYPNGPRPIPSGYPAHALPGNPSRFGQFQQQQQPMAYPQQPQHPPHLVRGYGYPQQQHPRPSCSQYYPGENSGMRQPHLYGHPQVAAYQGYPQQQQQVGNQMYYQGYPQAQQYPPPQYQSNPNLVNNPGLRNQGFQQKHLNASNPQQMVDNSQFVAYGQQFPQSYPQQQPQRFVQQFPPQQIYPASQQMVPQQHPPMMHSNSSQRPAPPFIRGPPVRTGFRNPGPVPPNFQRPMRQPTVMTQAFMNPQQTVTTQEQNWQNQQQQQQPTFQEHPQASEVANDSLQQHSSQVQTAMTTLESQNPVIPSMAQSMAPSAEPPATAVTASNFLPTVTPSQQQSPHVHQQQHSEVPLDGLTIVVPWGWNRSTLSDKVFYRRYILKCGQF